MNPLTPADLTNCALEAIHIPGSIQPHGALVAFTPEGALATRSTNAAALFGALPPPGEKLGDSHLTPEIRSHLAACLASPERPDSSEVTLPDGRAADLS